jgi:hypothetical protein
MFVSSGSSAAAVSNATTRPLSEIAGWVASAVAGAPSGPVARLTRTVAFVAVSRT